MCDVFGDILEQERKDARAEGREEGIEKGLAEGREEGKAEASAGLVAIIRKKHLKRLVPKEIAQILELEPEYVSQVVTLLENMPDAENLQIAKALVKMEMRGEEKEEHTAEV